MSGTPAATPTTSDRLRPERRASARVLQWALPLAFVALCGPLGAFMATNTPPGQVPDETGHIVKADSLLGGEVLARRAPALAPDGTMPLQQGVDGDFSLQRVANEPAPAQLTAEHWAQVHAVRWSGPAFIPLGTISGYWPAFYLPGAAGLGVAKALGASPFDAFLTARLFAFAVFVAAGTAALALARRGQALLFCALAAPMALHLGASVNQDGLLIAASALAVALLTRSCPADVAVPSPWPDAPRLCAAALIACVALAKPPYMPMAALLLLPLPPISLGRVWASRLGLAGAVTVAVLAWTWFTVRYVSTPVLRPPAEAGPLWPGPRPAVFAGTDFAGQMRVILAKPIRFLTLPWHTLMHDGILWDEAIGILGYLAIFLPGWLYRLWSWAAASALAADAAWKDDRAPVLPSWQVPIPLLCIATTVVGIYLSQYLSWTEVGGDHVEGPQGRYFLPLVPVLAFGLPALGRSAPAGAVLRVLPVAACLADLVVVPGLLVRYFYMH